MNNFVQIINYNFGKADVYPDKSPSKNRSICLSREGRMDVELTSSSINRNSGYTF